MQMEAESAQASLFGGSNGMDTPKPSITPIEPFGDIEKLNIEKEVVGLYISGHPLDKFQFEIDSFCNTELSAMNDLIGLKGKEIRLEQKWGDNRLEFKIRNIDLLNDLRDKKTKGVVVNMAMQDVTKSIIEEMESLCQQFKGECSFQMNLVDPTEDITVELMSRKYKINPNNELLDRIKKIPEVNYKILL